MTTTAALDTLRSPNRLSRLLRIERRTLERIADEASSHYSPFDLLLAKRGKWRHIDNPVGVLRRTQRRIQRRLLRRMRLPATMLGGVKGGRIHDNANFHVGRGCVVTMDLKRCFPSISDRRVFGVFKDHFGCSDPVAALLTRLTTLERCLPQGAPTSTTLANACLVPLHDELQALAGRAGVRVTFWVDDIAMSGENARAILPEAIEVVQRHGHAVSCKKLRVMPPGRQQLVTGAVLARTVSAGHRRAIEPMRERILAISAKEYPSDVEIRSVRGQISHVMGLNRRQGEKLLAFANERLPQTGFCGDHVPKGVERLDCRGSYSGKCRAKLKSGEHDKLVPRPKSSGTP